MTPILTRPAPFVKIIYTRIHKRLRKVHRSREGYVVESAEDLRARLRRIDGRGYKAYKDLAGSYSYDNFTLFVDHVQGDPFATPSRVRVRVRNDLARFPLEHIREPVRRAGLEDYLARKTAMAIREHAKGHRGTGKSGLIAIQRCGQEILQRTATVAREDYVECRLSIGLPAAGRTVLAAQAEAMFFQEIPEIVRQSLFSDRYDLTDLATHVDLVEDQVFLQTKLKELGLVTFLADGSVLPRESGVSDRPLSGSRVVPLASPPSLRSTISLPNRGPVTGTALPEGITLIVGGGYHGKTTVLRAIERGIYGHVPGDGRELVATREDAVKIRAEDGRSVAQVNISPFITNLPFMKDTWRFSTEDASGSTSQAANIVEAVELGTSVLLIDEDTSATNFMIRDERMQELVAKEKEPITPFIDKARMLYRDLGISSIIVIGGAGDYFDIADAVLMMDEYRPLEVTAQAKAIAAQHADERRFEGGESFGELSTRIPLKKSLNPTDRGKVRVKRLAGKQIQFGRDVIDLSLVEQLVDDNQTRAIADALLYAYNNLIDDRSTLRSIVESITAHLQTHGLDILSAYEGHPGEYALPRSHEIAAAFNRLRSLTVAQVETS